MLIIFEHLSQLLPFTFYGFILLSVCENFVSNDVNIKCSEPWLCAR